MSNGNFILLSLVYRIIVGRDRCYYTYKDDILISSIFCSVAGVFLRYYDMAFLEWNLFIRLGVEYSLSLKDDPYIVGIVVIVLLQCLTGFEPDSCVHGGVAWR